VTDDMNERPNGTVSYSVKELLARQDGKLDTIIMGLNAKAERTEVAALEQRVLGLERGQSSSKGESSALWRVAPLLLAVGTLALAAAVWVKP
jgi:hypothetical protein